MKLILAAAVGALVMGCSSQATRSPNTPVTQIPAQGGWFCQLNAAGDGWDCVQDRDLAENPRPERLPQPAPPPDSRNPSDPLRPDNRAPASAPLPTSAPDPQPQPASARPSPTPPRSAPATPTADRTAAAPGAGADQALPEYVRLAYRPRQAMALTELPAEFYAVQLVAMSSKEALESFVEHQGMDGMSAARVERDGKLFYVLLLGIYEDRHIARQAVNSLPEFDGPTPWIRPLGSLQAAMLRADQLAGSTRF